MEQHPHLAADGIHVIPMFGVRYNGCAVPEGAIGEVRWSPENGATYIIEFPGIEKNRFAEYYRNRSGGLGAGTVSGCDRDAEWIARTAYGGEIKLFATTKEPKSTQTLGTAGCSVHSSVKGHATFVSVELPQDNELAFWHDTRERQRLAFFGFDTRYWPQREQNNFSTGTGVTQTFRRTLRCSLTLSAKPLIEIVGGGSRQQVEQLKQAWVVIDDNASKEDWTPSAECRGISNFLSFILGVRTPFLWWDTFSDHNCLSRIYYGWEKVKTNRPFVPQLLPLSGAIEAFQHGQAVTDALPGLFRQFQQLHNTYEIDWIISPLWYAFDAFADDRLALACISLERFVAAYREPMFWTKDQRKHIQEALIMALAKATAEVNLDDEKVETLKRQVASFGHMTNADKTIAAFESVGLQLTPEEIKVIKKRNVCFHGNRTLKDSGNLIEMNEEMRRFDTIRMVIYKAVLSLLGYKGPYFDYAERPSQGNFPIKFMRRSAT